MVGLFCTLIGSRRAWLTRMLLLSSSLAGAAAASEPLRAPIWQLGEFFTDGGEFVGPAAPQAAYDISQPVQLKREVPLPGALVGPGAEGCHAIRLTFTQKQGCYALVRSVRRPAPRAAALCQLFANQRELGCFFTTSLQREPRPGGPETKPADAGQTLSVERPGSVLVGSPPEYQCVAYPFLCLQDGRQEVVLTLAAEANEDLRLDLDALALVQWTVHPRPHSLSEDIPGRVFLDAWGWMGTAWYQRSEPVDTAYFQKNLIDESAIRGANYLQLHPSLDQAPWRNSKIEAQPLLAAIHARDMVTDEHSFPPKAEKPPRQARRGQASEDEKEVNPRKLITPDMVLKWFRQTWIPLVADLPQRGWKESVDGFEGEALNAVFENTGGLKKMTDLLWQSNPGMWVSHASFPCGPVWLSEPKYRTPNYLKSPVCLHFLEFQLGPPEGGRVGFVGYDDKIPVIHPFPDCEGLHPPAGKMFLGYQADCRLKGTEIIRRPSRWIGGGSSADWVLKQVDDFFRWRARWPDDPHETAIWWLGEPTATLPLEDRDYVYAITQDPIKRALAATHAHGGIGGFLDQRKEQLQEQAKKEGADTARAQWWKLRPRSEFPATSHFIQNAYLCLTLFTDRDGGVLQYDLERLAHFDSDGLNLPLTSRLVDTDVSSSGPSAGGSKSFRQALEIEQRGGHLAVLRAKAEWTPAAGGRVTEQRRYLLVNDSPYVVMELSRSSSGVSGDIPLALGSDGYELLVADGKEFDRPAAFAKDALPAVLRLRDINGVKPDLVVLMLDKGGTTGIEWRPGGSLNLTGPVNDQLRLAWVVPSDLYGVDDMPRLAAAMTKLVWPVKASITGASLANPYDVPYAAVAQVEDPGNGPYLVQENGWWTVRGAQRSLAKENRYDYVKIYLSKGQSARLLPYGLIEGAAKPGYGCQYTVALRDVHGDESRAACQARVLSVTPFLFAPRVDFAKPVARVKLNGQPWHYFEGSLVFLPNLVGDYGLEVEYGPASVPAITRTFACVRRTAWNGSALDLEVSDPPWAGPLPEDVSYYALVHGPAGPPKEVQGAKLLVKKGEGYLIQYKPGKIRMNW
jgi:hypothetical protein